MTDPTNHNGQALDLFLLRPDHLPLFLNLFLLRFDLKLLLLYSID